MAVESIPPPPRPMPAPTHRFDGQDKPTSKTRRVMLSVAVATAVILLGAIARAILSDGSTSVFDLEIGDCFGLPGASATPSLGDEVRSVEVVACDVTHVYELIDVVVLDHPSDADFPGSDALFEHGSRGCVEEFETIVGTPLPASLLEIMLITPTVDSWDADDREIYCVAMRGDGLPLEDTVVGSGL